MNEFRDKDLAQVFKNFGDRLDSLEAQNKYPTESREKFMSACLKDKSMQECSVLWEKVSKKGYGEQTAYGKPAKPYGKTFIDAILETMEKAGIELTDEEIEKLKDLAGKTGEAGESFFSVLPQDEHTFRGMKVNFATGEIYREGTQAEIDNFVDEFMFAGTEHQRESEIIKQKFAERGSRITQEQHESELTKQRAELKRKHATGEDLKK